MKLLFVGDTHFRFKSSRWRVDNFYDTQLDKLRQILSIGASQQVTGIVFLGDFVDSPKEAYKLSTDLITTLKGTQVPLYTIVGNHDLSGYNLSTLDNSPLGVLVKSGVINLIDQDVVFPGSKVVLRGVHYESVLTPEKYLFDCYPDYFRLIASHNMIVPLEEAPFEFYHPNKINTNAHLVVSGHYHHPYDFTSNLNLERTKWINPGIPIRWTINEVNIQPKVAILTVDYLNGIHTWGIQYFPLTYKPANEAFDLTTPVGIKAKQNTVQSFIDTLQSTDFSSVNLVESIQQYGSTNNIEKGIIDEILLRIKRV